MCSQVRPARLYLRHDVIWQKDLWLPATSFNAGATARAGRRGTCGRSGLGGLRVWACGKAWHPGPFDEGGHPGHGGHGRPRGNSLFASEKQAMRLHRGGVFSNALG